MDARLDSRLVMDIPVDDRSYALLEFLDVARQPGEQRMIDRGDRPVGAARHLIDGLRCHSACLFIGARLCSGARHR